MFGRAISHAAEEFILVFDVVKGFRAHHRHGGTSKKKRNNIRKQKKKALASRNKEEQVRLEAAASESETSAGALSHTEPIQEALAASSSSVAKGSATRDGLCKRDAVLRRGPSGIFEPGDGARCASRQSAATA